MTLEQYQDKLILLEQEFNRKKKELIRDFALSNNTIGKGDVVTDHIGSIKVESISIGVGSNKVPCPIYYGVCLKKDGTERKDGAKRSIWQENII